MAETYKDYPPGIVKSAGIVSFCYTCNKLLSIFTVL